MLCVSDTPTRVSELGSATTARRQSLVQTSATCITVILATANNSASSPGVRPRRCLSQLLATSALGRRVRMHSLAWWMLTTPPTISSMYLQTILPKESESITTASARPAATATGFLLLQTNGGTGNVGIGETAPGSMLSVSGGGSFGSGYDTTAAPTGGLIIE